MLFHVRWQPCEIQSRSTLQEDKKKKDKKKKKKAQLPMPQGERWESLVADLGDFWEKRLCRLCFHDHYIHLKILLVMMFDMVRLGQASLPHYPDGLEGVFWRPMVLRRSWTLALHCAAQSAATTSFWPSCRQAKKSSSSSSWLRCETLDNKW